MNSSLDGAETLRAYKAQPHFTDVLHGRLERSGALESAHARVSHWVVFRMDILAACFNVAVCAISALTAGNNNKYM